MGETIEVGSTLREVSELLMMDCGAEGINLDWSENIMI